MVVQAQAQDQAQAAWGEQKWQVHTDQCPGELGRRQAHLSQETARPGVVQMCDWLCWASDLWMYPHFADRKTMAPLGTRIRKTRYQCEYVCNKGYVMWRLLSQLMGPACRCWSAIPLTISFSLPFLSTPPCSPDSVLEPDCGPTLPSWCAFRALPLTAPGPVSQGPALASGLALPPSPSPSPSELSLPGSPLPPAWCPCCVPGIVLDVGEAAVKEKS